MIYYGKTLTSSGPKLTAVQAESLDQFHTHSIKIFMPNIVWNSQI
jgi:hypothetical protein